MDVSAALPSNDGSTLIGRTRGALRSMRSALGGGSEYLQGLSNRIGEALSSSFEESDLNTSPSSPPTPPHRNGQDYSENNDDNSRRKLRMPR